MRLASLTGHAIPVLGCAHVEIKSPVKKLNLKAQMIVIDNVKMSSDGIVGTDFMSKYQCRIDFRNQQLQIGKTNFKFARNLVLSEQEAAEIKKT